ncbi:MAG: glycosyltransferase family 4 protein [Candidatus Eremiobacteraeota bacterium]|nr:glycosyltransferase family 4 protein [Candidatus Eremiobacteraeota bacterium]MBC5827652.1 glycosyltransferase family 4 protein [Candidatus Eremiobacteraeota bacterium]
MRALLVLRPDATERFGGDTVQALRTSRALRSLGVEVAVVETLAPKAAGFDIAHIFGIAQPEVCARQMESCRRYAAAVALSPVWLSRREFFARAWRSERILRKARAEKAARSRLRRLREFPAMRLLSRSEKKRIVAMERVQAWLLRAADIVLPNSAIEAREYVVGLGAEPVRTRIVRNAAVEEAFVQWGARRCGVVCGARIESMKNQAMLSLALRGSGVPLTLAGEAYDAYYLRLCRRWGGPDLQYTGLLSQAQLFQLFARSEIHAMPSWGETAGLASLEAAAGGAKLVVGNRGAEVEYFGDDAEYANPADPDSIRAAVMRAQARPAREAGDSLDRRIRRLSWRQAGGDTLLAYQAAISARPRS